MAIKPISPRAYYLVPESETSHGAMTADSVVVDDESPRWTGLYDQWGSPLYRVRDDRVVGFDLRGGKSGC